MTLLGKSVIFFGMETDASNNVKNSQGGLFLVIFGENVLLI